MMKQTGSWKVYATSILSALAIGALGGLVTSRGMATYDQVIKPSLTPPDWIFPVVWNLLYVLMGVGFARVRQEEPADQTRVALLYGGQLVANLLWTVLFFGLHRYGLAFLWLILLWILIFRMSRTFYSIDPLAGWLQIPYLLWVGFAGYLNLMVALLNQ